MINEQIATLYGVLELRTNRWDATLKRIETQIRGLTKGTFTVNVQVRGLDQVTLLVDQLRQLRGLTGRPFNVNATVNNRGGGMAGMGGGGMLGGSPMRSNFVPELQLAQSLSRVRPNVRQGQPLISPFQMAMAAAGASQRAQDASNARWEQFLASRAAASAGGSSWLGGRSGFAVGAAHGLRLPIGFGLTPALVGGTLVGGTIYGIGRSAINTESSIANLRAIQGLNPSDAAALGGQLGRVATDTPGVTRQDAFRMATTGARAGVATGDLPEFTRVMGRLSSAVPEADPETLSNSVLQTMGAFRMATSELEGFGSALLELDHQAKATAPEILDITRRLAGVGQAAGMTIAEVMALSAAMRDAGLRPESGATAGMRMLMKQLASGESRTRIATALGMTPEALESQFNRSPIDALGSIVKGIQAQPEGSARLSFIGDELGLNNVRDVMFMGLIGNQFDKIASFTQSAQAQIDRPEALARRSAIRTGTTESQFERLGAAAGDAANEIGSVFLPAVRGAASLLSEIFTAQAEAMRGLKGLAGGISGSVSGAMQNGIPLPGGGRMMTPGQAANAMANQAQLNMLPNRPAAGPVVGPAHGTVSGALAWDAVVGRWRLPADLSDPPGGWGEPVIQGPQLPGIAFGDMARMREMNPTMGQGELFSMFAGQVGRNFLPGMFARTEASSLASGARSLAGGAGRLFGGGGGFDAISPRIGTSYTPNQGQSGSLTVSPVGEARQAIQALRNLKDIGVEFEGWEEFGEGTFGEGKRGVRFRGMTARGDEQQAAVNAMMEKFPRFQGLLAGRAILGDRPDNAQGRRFNAAIVDPMSAVQQQQVDILDSSLEQQQVTLLGQIKDGIDALVDVSKAGGGGGVVPAILGGLGFGGQ